jgi:transposase
MKTNAARRYVGVDLHHDSFVVCVRRGGEQQWRRWEMEEIEEFVSGLGKGDAVAVEATGNTRWFCRQLAGHVGRVVVVNPHQFRLISQSVKKTDRRDAALLAEYLEKDLLPEVRQKTDQESEVAQMAASRDQLVKMRTMLKNQVHGLLRSHGVLVSKQQLASGKGRMQLRQAPLPAMAAVQREVLLEQIAAVSKGIVQLEKSLREAARKLPGYDNLISIKGIGKLSSAILLSAIGPVQDFADAGKLAAYFGLVPRVEQSNQSQHHGRITRQGNKLARTTLVQCVLVAKRYNPFLRGFYERIRQRRGTGKAIVAAARKLLTIVYYTLKNRWVFDDFGSFALAESPGR